MEEDRTLSVINNYEANLKMQQKEQLRRNILEAASKNPDQYAEATKLSRMNNVPPAIVASDIDTYRNNAKLDDMTADEIISKHGILAQWLENPDNAALVHDDIGALTTVFDGVENVGRSIGSGFELGFNGIFGSLATELATASKYVGQPLDRGLKYIGADPNSDADPFDDLSNFFQGYAVTSRKMSERIIQPAMKDAGTIERGVYSGIQSIASNLLGMIGSVITKNPGVGLVSAGVTTGGQSASQALEKGLPVDTALEYGITDAGIEVATEFLPITKFISDLKVGSSFGKTIAHQMATEVPGELVATTGQDFTNWVYLNPDKTFSDYAEQLPEDLAQTFIATVSSVGLQTGTLKLVDYAISDKEKVSIEKAKIANLKTDIQGAKLNTRDPEKMREVLKAANPENKTATIDAGVLSHFYQSGLDPEEFFNLVPDARTQFENAELSGSDINIPYDEFVYAIANAPTPNSYDFMTDFIKVDPDIEPNMHEWDMKDPDQVNALIRDILDQTREQFFSKYEQVQQLPLAEEIERRFRDTLMNPDIMGEKVRNAQTAADEAKVLMEYVSTRLSKGGKAAEDTFMQRLSKDKFFLTGYKPPMPKIIGTGSSFYDRLRAKYKAQQRNINKPRKKDMSGFAKPKREKATPTPLINALIEMGGIERGTKIAQELEHIGITTKSHPRLYKKAGKGALRGLDNIPLQEFEQLTGFHGHFKNEADQNGYVSEKDLLEKLRNETFGDYIRTEEQLLQEQQDEYDAQILDILDQEGVDITTATADDIDAALKAYKDRYDNEDGQQYYQGEIKTKTDDGYISIDSLNETEKQDIIDALFSERFKGFNLDVWEEIGNKVSSYTDEYIADEIFGQQNPIVVKRLSLSPNDIDNKNRSVSDKAVSQYQDMLSQSDAPAILISKKDGGGWKIIEGGHRLKAAQMSGKKSINAIDVTELEGMDWKAYLEGNDNPDMPLLKNKQYFQTDDKTNTPEFKKWFGDSKVVDADGKPLVVYHGTTADFDKFDSSFKKSREGFWFANSELASKFSQSSRDGGEVTGSNVMPVYLKIENPLIHDPKEHFGMTIDEIINEARKNGNDGIQFTSQKDGEKTFMAFEPEQIKSVFNRGTFDPNDPRIYYQNEDGQQYYQSNDFQERFIAAQDLRDSAKEQKYKVNIDGNGYVTVYHGTSQKNAEKIKSDGKFNESSFFSFRKSDVEYYAREKNKNGEVIEIKVDPRDIEYSTGSGEVFAPDSLVKSDNGYYTSINRIGYAPDGIQKFNQDNHAVTKFLNNGQTVIELFQKANESSLMHEMGHLFLDLDAQIANHPEAPQAFKDEFNATLAWLGIEKYSDAQVKHHEQFARGFEAYLYTGETPNAELKSVFQRMVIWFTRIYKNIKQLGVKINPEMKAVFDRLLATDEAIEAQKTDKLFNVDKATMEMLNPKQQEEYLKRKEQALQAAKEKLFRKAYRQKLREKTEWWKEESDKVRSEVEADLMKQPVYQAIIKLQDGQEKLNQDMVIKSIDRGNTINPIGKFEIKYLPRGIISKEGTLDPSVVADMHGFKSAEQMFNAMKSVDPYTKAVQKQTEERMIARHGDMLNDGTIENEALAMVMAEDTKAAQVELKALTEKTGILYPSDGDFEKAARLALSKLKVDQAIAPDKYYRAALKSARGYGAALAKKNYEAAAESKRKEIINKHLYAQSKKAREETTKALDHFKKLDKKPPKGNAKAVKIDPDYHEKIWDLLDKYDFNPKIIQKKELKLQLAALNQWIQAKEKDEDAVLIMPPELTAADGKTHYRDLTMNEFRAVRDLIDNLETQGRRKRKYIVEGKEKDLAEVTREMVDTAEKFTNPLEHPLTEDRRWLAKMGKLVGGIDAINTKIQQIMVKLDGGDNYGVWTRSVYEPMQRAVINQAIRMRQEGDNLRALMEKYYADDKKSFKDFIAERGGFTITREELISIAMHFTATEDNRAKLLDFYEKKHGWDEEFIRDVLTQMRSKDWQFVMGVRDLYESFWAETSAIEKRRFGYAPEKLEGLPTETFTTVDGTDIDVRGGYARIKYDSRHSFKAMANDLKDAYKELAIGSSSIAATKRGSMKERKASSGQAIRLDLDVIGEHIAEQVGIITMSETVENVAKVLRQDNVQEVMHNNLGREYKMMVDLWLQDVSAGEGTAAQVLGPILRKIRTNYTIGKLALKPLTALVQISGIVQTMADPDLGVKYTLHGLKDFLSQDPRTTSEQIRAKSAYMQERKFTLNRDVADALNEYTNKGKTIQDKAAALMLLPMRKVQAMVDMVTWKAAYIKALDDRMDDADAIRYADMSVSRLQGSGLSTDQAAIERGTLGNSVRKQEAVKTGTVLFSYFNAKYNIAKNAKIKYDNKQISAVDLAASITLSFLVEGLVSAFLMGQIDWDKDEDGETTLGEATIGLGQMALYNAASTIPYGRTVASTIQGFTPYDAFTAQLVALGKFIGMAAGDSYDLLTDTKDLEDINWESRAKTTIDAIGVFFAIPSSEAKVLIRAVNKEDPELMDYLVYQK